jgi:hypothetical protein
MRFKKLGIVEVGTADPSQKINLVDPVGSPQKLEFNFSNGACTLTVIASDNLNTVVRDYPLVMDRDFATALSDLFENHVRRIANVSYNEFKDLIDLQDEQNNK